MIGGFQTLSAVSAISNGIAIRREPANRRRTCRTGQASHPSVQLPFSGSATVVTGNPPLVIRPSLARMRPSAGAAAHTMARIGYREIVLAPAELRHDALAEQGHRAPGV